LIRKNWMSWNPFDILSAFFFFCRKIIYCRTCYIQYSNITFNILNYL
jgi:hypothetical protein